MSDDVHGVALVVDRAYGEKLVDLARRLHVWIVDSPPNRRARDRVWSEAPEYVLESGATIFFDDGTQTSDVVAARMLEDIDRHHGVNAHTPPMSRLEVYGASRTNLLSSALEKMGFTAFEEGDGRFTAVRLPEDAG